MFTLPANVSQNQCPPKLLRSNFLKLLQQKLLLSSWTFSCCFVYIWGWSKSWEIGGYQWTELLWYLWKKLQSLLLTKIGHKWHKNWMQYVFNWKEQSQNIECNILIEKHCKKKLWRCEWSIRLLFSNPWRRFDIFLYSGIDCIDTQANRMCVKLKKDRAVMVVFNQLVEQWPGLGGSWKEEKGGNQHEWVIRNTNTNTDINTNTQQKCMKTSIQRDISRTSARRREKTQKAAISPDSQTQGNTLSKAKRNWYVLK